MDLICCIQRLTRLVSFVLKCVSMYKCLTTPPTVTQLNNWKEQNPNQKMLNCTLIALYGLYILIELFWDKTVLHKLFNWTFIALYGIWIILSKESILHSLNTNMKKISPKLSFFHMCIIAVVFFKINLLWIFINYKTLKKFNLILDIH